MTAPIPGDKFIRTFSHYLDANEGRLASTTPTHSLRSTASSRTSNGTPASLYGIPIPYMSLLAAATPASSAQIAQTPYMPIRSTLTLDVHHLYFLWVQFEHLGLAMGDPAGLGDIPDDGVVDTGTDAENDDTPSIMSVGSIASTMSNLSLTSGWNFWQRKSSHSQQQQPTKRPMNEEIVHVHQQLARVSALKLHMNVMVDETGARSSQRVIAHYEKPLDPSVRLSLTPVFENLAFLELSGLHPRTFQDWDSLRPRLMSLVCKAASIEDAHEILEPAKDWPQLRMLSLADNNLTTIEAEPLLAVRELTHLNLSSNLLIDVPSALSNLYNLQSLNLSYNMISFITGINTVLGNIEELDLRGNRLTVLAGLDRLWALKRVDLRDNRIEDAAEVGRLTALPDLEDVWVQGNPFTALQPEYRVQLFVAFKSNDLDIKLDGAPPSFAERHKVQSQTAPTDYREPEAAIAVAKWPEPSVADNDVKEPAPAMSRAKSKKNKRVVRLGKQAQAAPIQDDPSPAEEQRGRMHRVAGLEEAVQKNNGDGVTRKASSSSRRRSRSKGRREREDEKKEQRRSRSPASDTFRRKIESMRREAGTEWLRVLQEMDLGHKKENHTSNNNNNSTVNAG